MKLKVIMIMPHVGMTRDPNSKCMLEHDRKQIINILNLHTPQYLTRTETGSKTKIIGKSGTRILRNSNLEFQIIEKMIFYGTKWFKPSGTFNVCCKTGTWP